MMTRLYSTHHDMIYTWYNVTDIRHITNTMIQRHTHKYQAVIYGNNIQQKMKKVWINTKEKHHYVGEIQSG